MAHNLNDRLRNIYLQNRHTKRMVLLTGAGVSFAASNNKLALWPDLLRHGLQYCVDFSQGEVDEVWRDGWTNILEWALEANRAADLVLVGEAIQSVLEPVGEMQRWMDQSIGSLHREHHQLLNVLGVLDLPIATVNYDHLLEEHLARGTLGWSHGAALQWPEGPRGGDILHIHGEYKTADNIVLGVRSYEISKRHEPIQQVLRNMATQHNLLFIGWGSGLQDPNFGALFAWLSSISHGHAPPHFVLVRTREVKSLRDQLRMGHPVQVVPYGDNYIDLVTYLKRLVGGHSDPDAISILDVHRKLETVRRQHVFNPKPGSECDIFCTPAFAEAAQMAKKWTNELSTSDRAYLLKGSLFIGMGEGFGLYDFLPEPNADWAMDTFVYFLENEYRTGRYRSAIVLQYMDFPGRIEAVNEALAKSNLSTSLALSQAIQEKTVRSFIEDPKLCNDLEEPRREALIRTADGIRDRMNK